ncbi:uncharacterized protein PADG_00724 [Paracoccidioides brasiliensis Pb18]|uniref:Protein-tyrosine phosphatase n=2 Tax=Paracoccidioides brasiliensis TaxID=121759 RepID=C1G1I4_PARBD|nr:uncharacterized protein PADG_00724 [Paracoccidioides brasiliensis Pb18]EEH44435.2 hypothetical protein PADG_00724 [Paracoccidioides brasiliensis Pb18]
MYTRVSECTVNVAPQVVVDSSASWLESDALDGTPGSSINSGSAPAPASAPALSSSALSPDSQSSRSNSSSRHRTHQIVRNLLGQAKLFRLRTAAKMSEVHFQSLLLKRSRSDDSRVSGKMESLSGEEENALVTGRNGDENGDENEDIPTFLNLPGAEIHKKFVDIEILQAMRLSGAEGTTGGGEQKFVVEDSPEILPRNRYINIQVWSHSRIHLKVPDGECDFINASPISLTHPKTGATARYIAAQGPKSGYLEHFWNMVFHETGDTAVVVMLTQTYEQGKEKCALYFPLNMDAPVTQISRAVTDPFVDRNGDGTDDNIGKVTILECTYDEECRSEVRKLELILGSQSKIVWHYLFAGWSDYTKPQGKDRNALIKLTKATAEKAGSLDNPRVVHCSAGVGRTGTFITIDHLLREMRTGDLLKVTGDSDPIFNTVNLLREQRMCMVYTESQYQFLYDILKEQVLLFLSRDVNARKLKSPGSRSQKLAKLSSDTDTPFEPTQKEELVPVVDIIPSPVKS